MRKKLLPPIHPGEIIREVHEAAGPVCQCARATHWRNYCSCQRDRQRAARYHGRYGTTAEFWMNLQQRYELEAARREVGVAVEREVAALDMAG